MASTKLTVQVETLAVETGIWCPACALPSGVEVAFTTGIGSRLTVGSLKRCRECGEPCA